MRFDSKLLLWNQVIDIDDDLVQSLFREMVVNSRTKRFRIKMFTRYWSDPIITNAVIVDPVEIARRIASKRTDVVHQAPCCLAFAFPVLISNRISSKFPKILFGNGIAR